MSGEGEELPSPIFVRHRDCGGEVTWNLEKSGYFCLGCGKPIFSSSQMIPVPCPRCGETLRAVYPLGYPTKGADFVRCLRCKLAFHPSSLQVLAHVV